MVIFLHGPDDYRREKKRREIIAQFVAKHPAASVIYWDAAEQEARSEKKAESPLLNFRNNQSLFDSARLLVIYNPRELSPTIIKEIKTVISEKKLTLLLSEGGKLVKVWDFVKTKTPGLVQEVFEYLEGAAWQNFIQAEAKARKLNLSAVAINRLASRYAKNTWALVTELNKLSALGRPVEQKDVGRADSELAPAFWPMISGLASNDLGTRLTMLEKMWALGESAAKLFNLIGYQNPQKIARVAELDLLIKSGKLDYEEALLALLIA